MKKAASKSPPTSPVSGVVVKPAASRGCDDSPKAAVSRDAPAGTSVYRSEFEELYQRHSREVWALAYARWMNADTAMDITQEAFLRLWKQTEAGEAILNPRAWLLRVARNLAE